MYNKRDFQGADKDDRGSRPARALTEFLQSGWPFSVPDHHPDNLEFSGAQEYPLLALRTVLSSGVSHMFKYSSCYNRTTTQLPG